MMVLITDAGIIRMYQNEGVVVWSFMTWVEQMVVMLIHDDVFQVIHHIIA